MGPQLRPHAVFDRVTAGVPVRHLRLGRLHAAHLRERDDAGVASDSVAVSDSEYRRSKRSLTAVRVREC